MSEILKEYRKRVETAINRALSDSPEINEAIEKIREEGYDVFLIVEATIGFNPKEGGPPKSASALDLTTHDHKFLRALKISPE
jgi:hypothetical protein